MGKILNNLNEQNFALIFYIIAYYVITLPLAYYLAFEKELWIVGIWLARGVGGFFACCAFMIKLYIIDWDKSIKSI